MHPVFGKIIDLVTMEDTLIICIVEYYGDTFSSHYNAFIIKSRGIVSVINMHSLADHRLFYAPSSFTSSDKELYITLPSYCISLSLFIKCCHYVCLLSCLSS